MLPLTFQVATLRLPYGRLAVDVPVLEWGGKSGGEYSVWGGWEVVVEIAPWCVVGIEGGGGGRGMVVVALRSVVGIWGRGGGREMEVVVVLSVWAAVGVGGGGVEGVGWVGGGGGTGGCHGLCSPCGIYSPSATASHCQGPPRSERVPLRARKMYSSLHIRVSPLSYSALYVACRSLLIFLFAEDRSSRIRRPMRARSLECSIALRATSKLVHLSFTTLQLVVLAMPISVGGIPTTAHTLSRTSLSDPTGASVKRITSSVLLNLGGGQKTP